MNDKRKKQHEALLVKFDPPDGYNLRDYYGTMMMKIKKNNKFQIKLVYDYKRHSVTSSSIVVNDIGKCLKLIELMEEFSKDGTEQDSDIDLMLDDV